MTDDKENSKYVIGDLLWAKIGHYPYWPCMVSYDPLRGSYLKRKTVRGVETVIYHVQYFGKQTQHGWTLPGLIFPFEGEQQYHANRRRLVKEAASPSLKKKVKAKYFVPPGIHEAWIIAVREAEDALEYEIHERYTSFVFKYDMNLKKSKSSSQVTVEKGPSKKRKKNAKGTNKKPLKALEIYGNGEDICKICEKGNVDLTCLGDCALKFHKDCLGLINVPENFKCNYCEEGVYTCFVCKKSDTSTFKCLKCKFHYHQECLKKFHCANIDKKICSYHVCVTCYNANPRNVSSKGPFINCIRCPTTFHATVHCMPLGSVKLSSTTMICPEHYLGKKKVSPQMSLNISYCLICFTGGELFCCETCPNAYHISCYGRDPAGDFYCDDCQKRQYLHAGMVVWVKTGLYRWWPALALNVEDLPENVRCKDHYDGEFPVQYFGTDEYFWTHRGRVIPYLEIHKSFKSQMSSKSCKLNGYFKLSLEEAAEAFDNYLLQQKISNVKEHSHVYKHIRVNRAIPPATFVNSTNGSVKEEHNCDCDKKNATCGPNSGCLNRDMMVECPSCCSVGDRCENQKFQKRQYAKVQQFRTENCGWGLRSAQIINIGDFVIEYVGEVITHDEYKRRAAEMQEKAIPNYYFLYLDARRMIDAGPQGNLSRFINHSCDPNCEMSKWSVNGDSRIGIFAIKKILPGEELTFNYQSDSVEFSQRCFCGAKNCQGFIGRNGEKHKIKKLKTK